MLGIALALTLALRLLVQYPLHPIIHADLSPEGNLLATSHMGNYLEVRSLKPRYLDGRLFSPVRTEIEEISFLSERKLLIIRRNRIEIWERQEIADWKLSLELERTGPVAISESGKLIAYTPSEDRISIFDTKNKVQISTIDGLPDFVKSMSFSQDESALFALLSSGEIVSYDTKTGNMISEIGEIKGKPLLYNGKAFIIKERKLTILNLGDLSKLHTLKARKKIQKVLVKGDEILLISREGGYLYKLKDGKYLLDREIEGIKGKKIKLTSKGILIWSKKNIEIEGRFSLKVSNIPVPERITIAGDRLAEAGRDFALVWNLREFLPEFFYRGRSKIIGDKIYLKIKDGYLCYDLKKGESRILRTNGKIVEGNEPFIWKAPYLKWKEDKIRLEKTPAWVKIFPEENVLITNMGVYDLKTKEKILNLEGKKFFISKIPKSLVILRKGGIIVYRLGSRIAKDIDIEYSKAFIDEEGSKLALIPPYDYGLIILDLQSEEESEIEDENTGRVKGALFFDSKLIIWGENGFSAYEDGGKRIFFRKMSDIDRIIRANNGRIIIIKKDGTLWLYSIRRNRPVLYHDLNGIAKMVINLPNAILVGLETGEVLALSKRNLTPWLRFIYISMRDWLVLSSENYFNASPLGRERIAWLKGRYIYPNRLALERYMNPKELRRIWNELQLK